MMIFHGNLRKNTEIIENFVAKILKICLKTMYTLNRYAGNVHSHFFRVDAGSFSNRRRVRAGV